MFVINSYTAILCQPQPCQLSKVPRSRYTGKPHCTATDSISHQHHTAIISTRNSESGPSVRSAPHCTDNAARLDKSRAQRILWLLEELKLEYELKVFKRGKDWMAPKELKDLHPLGKAPVIGIQAAGAEKPLVLAESGAIIEYLAEHFGRWMVPQRYPEGRDGELGAETEAWLRYRVSCVLFINSGYVVMQRNTACKLFSAAGYGTQVFT